MENKQNNFDEIERKNKNWKRLVFMFWFFPLMLSLQFYLVYMIYKEIRLSLIFILFLKPFEWCFFYEIIKRIYHNEYVSETDNLIFILSGCIISPVIFALLN